MGMIDSRDDVFIGHMAPMFNAKHQVIDISMPTSAAMSKVDAVTCSDGCNAALHSCACFHGFG